MLQTSRPELEQFLEIHSLWILGLARVMTPTRSEAEDLAQDALVRAIRHWDKLRAAGHPRAYLRRLVVNEYISSRRSAKPTVQLTDRHQITDPGLAGVEDSDHTSRLLAPLPPRQQAALALRFLEDCSYSEVAAALRCREATARSLVKRGLDAIRASQEEVMSSGQAAGTRERAGNE